MKPISTTIAAALAGMLATGPGHAGPDEKSQTELDALRARVEVLEAERAKEAETAEYPFTFSFQNGTTVGIYGYIKGDLIYDDDANLGTTTFGLKNLAPGAPSNDNFQGHAKQTRLGVDISNGAFDAKIEGDFFGGTPGTDEYRLRHAYGEYKGLLVGQSWSNFGPLFSYPATLDFQGPAGMPFARVMQARYTYDTGNGFSFSAAIEEDKNGNATEPSYTAAAKYDFDRGAIRLAGISRDITDNLGKDIAGRGVSLAGAAERWQGGSILGNYHVGDGLADHLVFALGTGVANPNALFFGADEVEAESATVGISQQINEKWTLSANYGLTELDRAPALATKELQSVHVTALYSPRESLTFGLEYFYGENKLGNGTTAEADRLQFSTRFDF